MSETVEPEGWGFPGSGRKAHYFVGAMSLCRKWGFYFGPLEPDNGKPSSDDCVACRREFEKRPGGNPVVTETPEKGANPHEI